ncbi:MAG: AI-2E family transporter [Gammaproteobacteria bacterium]|nr:AI-2E family transporter [Gammaproteobacteria bacterium]
MIQVVSLWFRRYLSDPQAVLLVILLLLGFTVLYTMGGMLAPVLAGVIIAFLLEGTISYMSARLPRMLAVWFAFLGFVAVLLFLLVVLLPLLSYQLSQVIQESPKWVTQGKQLLMQLPERYPEFISIAQIESLNTEINNGIAEVGQVMVSYSISSIPALITLLVYLILVPILVFFFLKDKALLLLWFGGFLPVERPVAKRVWAEMMQQMGNYVRGKLYEVFIVGSVSYVVFALMGLNYSPLLGALVGVSVFVPYLGAAVVTFPVALVAYFQWGLGPDFGWLLLAYGIIQALDGNVLVPLLFSEAVNLHPIAIIVAVLAFGGLWGFWGVFFAIPLGTLVKSLLVAWPRIPVENMPSSA